MKKKLALLIVLVMVLSMTACGKKDPATDEPEASGASATNPAVEEAEEAEEVEDDAFTHTFTQYGNARIKIVGAEAVKGDRGDDLLRIYYDYTNTDDTANGHMPETALHFLSVTQDGEDCSSTYQFETMMRARFLRISIHHGMSSPAAQTGKL